MGRAIFDDITPPENNGGSDVQEQGSKHSIRDVAPPTTEEREKRREKRAERRTLEPTTAGAPASVPGRKARMKFGNIGMWVIAVAVLVAILSVVGFVFIGKTTITIEPQHEKVNVSANVVYTAYQEAEEGELAYTLLTHSIDATDTIAATGHEEVAEKASGRIMVYNNHSSSPQRLIKNTRFEAPSGEIYRVRNSFVVPGMTGDTPGSIEVTVHADKSGEAQNITALGTKFTIPGLKGDPRYDTFHAELAEPIIGGFVGERAIVDEDVLNASRTKLQGQLRDGVDAALEGVANSDVHVFSGGVFTAFESQPVTYNEGDEATVKETLRITAVTFDTNALARMLATVALASPEDGDVLIDTPESLTMTIVNKDGVDIVNDALIQFTLEGSTALTWQVDTDSIKQELVGKNSTALNSVMSAYPGIKSAQATIRPFWKKEFPTEVDRIDIELLITE